MKALSIKQPLAELILQGRKTIEIRSWNTRYRGYFLIHASKKPDIEAIKVFDFDLERLLCGYILGYAKLSDVIIYNSEKEFMKDKDKHLSIHGKTKYPAYGFIFKDIHRIEPIKYKGKLGFFEVREIEFNDIYK
jgi:hypothetical protein